MARLSRPGPERHTIPRTEGSLSVHSLFLPAVGGHIRWIDIPGSKAEPPHVYVHGLGCAGSADFAHIATQPSLVGHRAIIVDLLGHGYSDRPADFSYTLHDHAQTVADVLDHLGIRRSVLVGHSMGGAIAIILASEREGLVSRVIAAEPNWHAGGGLFSKPIAQYGESEFLDHGFDFLLNRYDPTYAARVRVTDPRAMYRGAVGLVQATEPDMAERFLALPHRRALIVGAHSRPYEEEDVMCAAGIPVIGVPNAGHDLMHENPQGFAAAIARSLR
jgi:pimeloyl-ACP methyl ester carboxylesterase